MRSGTTASFRRFLLPLIPARSDSRDASVKPPEGRSPSATMIRLNHVAFASGGLLEELTALYPIIVCRPHNRARGSVKVLCSNSFCRTLIPHHLPM